jgi:hypothetical protein
MRGVSIKPAQWKYWVEMKDVELIEAVLLSVNIDPRFVPQNFKRPDTPRVTIPGFSDLDEKTDIALNHFGDKRFERADLRKRVKLAEFRAWAEGLLTPWTFPDQFPGSLVAADALDIDSVAYPCVVRIDGSTTGVANTHTKTWKTDALQIAQEVLERDRKEDRHPTLTDLANSVAKLMRGRGINNSRNQPPSATTILRHVFTAEWREKFGFKAKKKRASSS